jgi:hypothetical protein
LTRARAGARGDIRRNVDERADCGAAMKLFPRRPYGQGRRFAVAGRVEYRHVEQDELLGSTDDCEIAFEVRDGLLELAAPQPTAADALARSGLTEEALLISWE